MIGTALTGDLDRGVFLLISPYPSCLLRHRGEWWSTPCVLELFSKVQKVHTPRSASYAAHRQNHFSSFSSSVLAPRHLWKWNPAELMSSPALDETVCSLSLSPLRKRAAKMSFHLSRPFLFTSSVSTHLNLSLSFSFSLQLFLPILLLPPPSPCSLILSA